MILAILAGNTNTRVGWFAGRKLTARDTFPTADWSAATWHRLRLQEMPKAVAVASVVPGPAQLLRKWFRRTAGPRVFAVDRYSVTGLKIRYRRPQLGPDRLCAAVAAHERYPGDLVVLDLGTATTVNVVTGNGVFLGGEIMPGVASMFETLARSTALLPRVTLSRTRVPMPRSTVTAIRAGVNDMIIGGLEYSIGKIEKELGSRVTVVATGGWAPRISPRFEREVKFVPGLALMGLVDIFHRNSPDFAG